MTTQNQEPDKEENKAPEISSEAQPVNNTKDSSPKGEDKSQEVDKPKTVAAYSEGVSEEAGKKATEKLVEGKDEFAEKPEDVLDDKDLKELEEIKNGEKKKELTFEEKRDKERRRRRGELTQAEITEGWEPKTKLGDDVKAGRVKKIDDILESGKKILESEIVDSLLQLKSDLISIGQSKGKFGGGKRRAWRQTQRKTKEGNVPTFTAMAVVGDANGHVGIGSGKAMETLPARDKAIRKAKLNIMKVGRG